VECKFYFVCSSVCLLWTFNVDVVFFLLVKKGGQKGDNKKLLLLAFSKKFSVVFLGFSDVSLVCCIAIPAHVHCFVVLSCCVVVVMCVLNCPVVLCPQESTLCDCCVLFN